MQESTSPVEQKPDTIVSTPIEPDGETTVSSPTQMDATPIAFIDSTQDFAPISAIEQQKRTQDLSDAIEQLSSEFNREGTGSYLQDMVDMGVKMTPERLRELNYLNEELLKQQPEYQDLKKKNEDIINAIDSARKNLSQRDKADIEASLSDDPVELENIKNGTIEEAEKKIIEIEMKRTENSSGDAQNRDDKEKNITKRVKAMISKMATYSEEFMTDSIVQSNFGTFLDNFFMSRDAAATTRGRREKMQSADVVSIQQVMTELSNPDTLKRVYFKIKDEIIALSLPLELRPDWFAKDSLIRGGDSFSNDTIRALLLDWIAIIGEGEDPKFAKGKEALERGFAKVVKGDTEEAKNTIFDEKVFVYLRQVASSSKNTTNQVLFNSFYTQIKGSELETSEQN